MENYNTKDFYLKTMGIDIWRLRRADPQPKPIIYSIELLDKQGICAAYLLIASSPETLEKSTLELLDAMLKAIDLRRSLLIIPLIRPFRLPSSTRGEGVFILIMGEKPAQYFLDTQENIASLRCNNPHKKTVCVTYNPQEVQRNPELKRPVWQDLCLFKSVCDSDESLRERAVNPK